MFRAVESVVAFFKGRHAAVKAQNIKTIPSCGFAQAADERALASVFDGVMRPPAGRRVAALRQRARAADKG
jgi:hypothetical protein